MNKQFENYKQAIEAAFPDIIGEDGFLKPDFEGLDILRDVDEKQLIQIFSDAHSLPEFKTLVQQAHLAAIEEEKRQQEAWKEQQLQEQFEEQEKMDEVYANATVDGDIWNLKPEAARSIEPATDDQISKVLDKSIGGHGFWLINHRDIIEKLIADRIEVAGISQTMMDVGYSWLRSENEPYSDLELDMYEVIAKYNGDVDKEGKMTKKADIYKAINKRIREKKIKKPHLIEKSAAEKLDNTLPELTVYDLAVQFDRDPDSSLYNAINIFDFSIQDLANPLPDDFDVTDEELKNLVYDNLEYKNEDLKKFYNSSISHMDYEYTATIESQFELNGLKFKVQEHLQFTGLWDKTIDPELKIKADNRYSLSKSFDGWRERGFEFPQTFTNEAEFIEAASKTLADFEVNILIDDIDSFFETGERAVGGPELVVRFLHDFYGENKEIDVNKFLENHEFFSPITLDLKQLSGEELEQVKTVQIEQISATLEGLQQEVYKNIGDDSHASKGPWSDVQYWVNDLQNEFNNMQKIQEAEKLVKMETKGQIQKEASNENLEKLSIKEQQGEVLDIEAQAESLNLKLTDAQREKIQELPPEGRKHLLESLVHINDTSHASTNYHEQNKVEADLDMGIF